MMVPVAVASPSVAFVGLDNLTVNVSSCSSMSSSVVITRTVNEPAPVSAAPRLNCPPRLSKSSKSSAVSPGPTSGFNVTYTVRPVGADREILNSTFSPSIALPSDMLTVGGGSSSMIVPVAVEAPSRAFVGFDRLIVNLSFHSYTESLVVDTRTVFLVSPGAKVSVPDAAVKSLPLFALTVVHCLSAPLAVAY